MKRNITSHCFGCFWVHIEWNQDGTGTDQKGRKWHSPSDPKPIDSSILIPIMEAMSNGIRAVAKMMGKSKLAVIAFLIFLTSCAPTGPGYAFREQQRNLNRSVRYKHGKAYIYQHRHRSQTYPSLTH